MDVHPRACNVCAGRLHPGVEHTRACILSPQPREFTLISVLYAPLLTWPRVLLRVGPP
jgi:hypothetical protein